MPSKSQRKQHGPRGVWKEQVSEAHRSGAVSNQPSAAHGDHKAYSQGPGLAQPDAEAVVQRCFGKRNLRGQGEGAL